MDELRVVRREEGTLILANELGEEYRFVIDEEVSNEIRQITRRSANSAKVRPREIQALLRAGRTRAEVAAEVGIDEVDVERFEEPVRAEQRYMLELAHAVTVRTDPGASPSSSSAPNAEDQRFGQVISERLIGLGNTESSWRSWRDEDAGWLIGLTFDSRDDVHDAVWSFDHRKRVLSPLTPDATNLSKSGEVGDRLIPKLRAVDNEPQGSFSAGAFDPEALLSETGEIQLAPSEDDEPVSDDTTPLNADAEYARRRDIDHLAVNTPSTGTEDLSQTADLLDALRRRRGERNGEFELLDLDDAGSADEGASPTELTLPIDDEETRDSADTRGSDADIASLVSPPKKPRTPSGAAANIWGTSGVSGVPSLPKRDETPKPSSEETDSQAHKSSSSESSAEAPKPEQSPREQRGSKRGRSPIPSWDDILFGTRSDDDPA